MKTTVVNMKQIPHNWRQDSEYVYIGRGSLFGNPFKIGHKCSLCDQVHKDGGSTLDCYEDHFRYSMTCPVSSGPFETAVRALRGKKLVCFCKPAPCHGDIIKRWLDAEYGDEP